jgi:hypothetical protein
MVALFRDIISDEPCGVHRTFLDAEGRKLGRKMLGRAKGAAIKLDPDDAVTAGLFLGEGVETTMTGRQYGLSPAWALGSAVAIGQFPLLAGIEVITIFAERRADGSEEPANFTAINQVADRYLDAGRRARIIDPPRGDLNDVVDRRAS